MRIIFGIIMLVAAALWWKFGSRYNRWVGIILTGRDPKGRLLEFSRVGGSIFYFVMGLMLLVSAMK